MKEGEIQLANEKRFFWLKLKEDFFDETYIKALRKMPGGDAMVIVYLKMQLKSLRTEGIMAYQHILPNQAEEIAIAIDEDAIIVAATIQALQRINIIEIWDNETLYMAAMQELIGSESSVAARVRKHREIKEMLHCNAIETKCNTEIERELERELEIKQEISIVTPNGDCGQRPRIDYELIVNSWNSLGLSQVTKITPSSSRCKSVKARVREYGIDNILKAISLVKESEFLMGHKTDFVITFDWLFKPRNFPKVLEGNYTTREVQQQKSSNLGSKIDKFNSMDSHNWNFDEIETLERERIDRKLRGQIDE